MSGGVLRAVLPFAMLLAGVARGATAGEPALPEEPGAHLTVYLMTMGPGERVWERFGHNAIWIHDPVAGTDETYNYGLFDFGQEDFLVRFIRGRMWYWMAGFPAEDYVRSYRRDNRSVWVQELNLPPPARLELQRFLRWNELPENRFYHYDYYRDNCSTRVRDALDRVTGGALRAQTAEVPAGTTYRFHTQRLTANDPPIFTGLLLALGEGVDRPISRWEESFLPLALRQHVREVRIPAPRGGTVPLVRSERTLFESTAPVPPAAPPRWLPWYLVLGLAIGGSAAALGARARRSGAARVALGGLIGAWGLVAGLAGTILAGLWGLTDHAAAYRNENLFQVNPLALALVVIGVLVARKANRGAGFSREVANTLTALAAFGWALQVLPGLDQVNGPIIALALPVHAGISMALRLAR